MMLLLEHLERGYGRATLNLARNIEGDRQSFKRSFDTQGCSAKEVFSAIESGIQIFNRYNIDVIKLPYVPESKYFVTLLTRLQEEGPHPCNVKLIIPHGVDTTTLSNELFNAFCSIDHVSCHLSQEVRDYVDVDPIVLQAQAGHGDHMKPTST